VKHERHRASDVRHQYHHRQASSSTLGEDANSVVIETINSVINRASRSLNDLLVIQDTANKEKAERHRRLVKQVSEKYLNVSGLKQSQT